MTTELTTEGLPSGKTVEEAIARAAARRERIWNGADWAHVSEDEKLEALEVYCIALYRGNTVNGKLLCTTVIWGG